jgi:carbonic anhydrase
MSPVGVRRLVLCLALILLTQSCSSGPKTGAKPPEPANPGAEIANSSRPEAVATAASPSPSGLTLPPSLTEVKDIPPVVEVAPDPLTPESQPTLPPASKIPEQAIESSQKKIEPKPSQSKHAHIVGRGIPAEQSLRWLANGNTRFLKGQQRPDGRRVKDLTSLAGGQKPHAIVLSCSDSRVPPELLFDQVPGEIFVVRSAGQSVDQAVIASLEYAVEHLGPQLLVVLGHTSCGAVKATLETKEGQSAGSEALDALVADIRPRLRSVSKSEASAGLEVESALNADGVARDLTRRSDILRRAVDEKKLIIKPALVRLDSGRVRFY